MKKMIGSFVILSFLLIGIPSAGVFAQGESKQAKKAVTTKKKQAPKKVISKKKTTIKSVAKPVKQVRSVKPLKIKTAPKAKPKVKKQEQQEDANEENNEELLDLQEELDSVTKELESAEKSVEEEKALPTPMVSPIPSGDAPLFSAQPEGPAGELSEKEKKTQETKAKLESLKKKISEIKKIEPVEVKKIEIPIKTPLKNIGNPLTDTYENEDKPMREYWKTHPGSYGPPLLKYNLPSGIF